MKTRKSEQKDKGPCANPRCWEKAITSGYCGACYRGTLWLLRHRSTPKMLSDYVHRHDRIANRATSLMAGGNVHHVGEHRPSPVQQQHNKIHKMRRAS